MCNWPCRLEARGLPARSMVVHLGVEREFRPARKAHPALQVEDLPLLVEKLRGLGYAVKEDEPLEGFHRIYVDDPFGNRIELLEPLGS
jgi:hypothetical protein